VRTKAPVSYRRAFVLILLFVSLTGCLHSVQVVDEKDSTTTISWLIDGKTTKEEVMRNCRDITLMRTLSQGKILIYCVNFDQQKGQFTCSLPCVIYELVLIFDERDIVKRHSIVKNR